MLPKLISHESRDLLGFYCGASIVYNIMLLKLILTPSFSNPILEKNAVGVRIDTLHVQQPLLYCSIKIQVNKCKSFTRSAFKTIL